MMTWQTRYRAVFFICLVLLLAVLFCFPYFFEWIEKRNGMLLHDPLLAIIPSYDLSVPIFILIWMMTILMLIRCVRSPAVCILFLWSYLLLCLSRIITITLIPLAPPYGLIELKDPLTNIFYGGKFISKDLFYSGHTATQFLIFLCLTEKRERRLALFCTIAIAIMLLVQHVHYTIDVLAAPFFAWLVYKLARLLERNYGLRVMDKPCSRQS